jgi:hypothetical protein
MYQVVDNILCVSVNDWVNAGLSTNILWKDSKQGLLSIVRRGIKGNTLIDFNSIKRVERKEALEASMGSYSKEKDKGSIYKVEISSEALAYYSNYEMSGTERLSQEKIAQYTAKASLMEALKKGMARQVEARAKAGVRICKKDFWAKALEWQRAKAQEMGITPYGNVRSFERAFKEYLKEGYEAMIHKGYGNDSSRVVSKNMANLFLALWRSEDKPFVSRVWELYLEFVRGKREFYDKKSGEVYRPEDFRYKDGRALEVSLPTVWNYLKDVVNSTAVYADRNGGFDYANSQRPKHNRMVGAYSLSKISLDDVALSRKSIRGWVYKYICVDVVSGYHFRPAYIVGKPTLETVMQTYRNMFCELALMGLPMPAEVEVEHHLMKDIGWLNDVFQFVRFCSSPTEKRVEHTNRQFKYGVAKRNGHSKGRWYSRAEAYKCVRNKVEGDYEYGDKGLQPQSIVADDLRDIEQWNNELHPNQKTYRGKTRKDVFVENINPNLRVLDKAYLYKYIGNETLTSIRNNDWCSVDNEEFQIKDFGLLDRLTTNNKKVTAYWLPESDGEVKEVYLYQEGEYIGVAENRKEKAYNECEVERTEEDEKKMLAQCKRIAGFDKKIRERKAQIPHIGIVSIEEKKEIEQVDWEIVANEQPKGYDYEDESCESSEDYREKAMSEF